MADRRGSQAPFGIVGEYAHPVEILFLGFGTGLGPLLFARDLHLVSLWFYMAARLWQVRAAETERMHAGPAPPGSRTDPGWPRLRELGKPVRGAQVVDAHSGYDFPWSLHNFLPFWAGTAPRTAAASVSASVFVTSGPTSNRFSGRRRRRCRLS